MNPIADDILMHYGMKYRSGRYPYGSGDDPYQHGRDFLGRVDELKKQGWTETAENVKKAFGPDVTLEDYRNEKAWCNYERKLRMVETAKRLRDKEGLGYTEIGKKLGINESSVRSMLDPKRIDNMEVARKTADFLKEQVDQKKMIDVGAAVERELGVSRTKFDQALYGLEGEGYVVLGNRFDQVNNPGKKTTQAVLCVPGTPKDALFKHPERVQTITEYTSHDGGDTFDKLVYPKSMDSKRLMIRYKEDGGVDKDGIIELRRGVDDISLGNDRYAQVRILVDNDRYLKGMAVYSDDMPKGVDVIFNTNKSKDVPMRDVLKPIKQDNPDNPFGSNIKPKGQSYYEDKNGNKQLRLINKTRSEGDWSDWQDTLPSQFLSKQSKTLAKKQLDIAKADKMSEFEDYCKLQNPTIKKYYLEKFADSCDSAAVNLKAAALPGQKHHVIIPITSMKDTEVFAPKYQDGTKLALVRYPHGGIFEIPILTVNNKQPVAKKLLGLDVDDAIGINSKVAERLSGADFDGDTVMCIPTHDKAGRVRIANKDPLPGLVGFDPKAKYGYDEVRTDSNGNKHYYRNGNEFRIMKNKQNEMGVISNLITDMTLGGANDDELARAVRHSMVVIDAEKHKLDYKSSEVENDIRALKNRYQRYIDEDGNERSGGAGTIISRAKGQTTVDRRQGGYKINEKGKDYYDPTKPEGAKLWKTTDDLYYPERKYDKDTGIMTIRTVDGKRISYNVKDKKDSEYYKPVMKTDSKTGDVIFTNSNGDIVYRTKKRTQDSTKMAETNDATTLVSAARHPMELIYADYANSMKSLANKARLELVKTGNLKYNREANKEYKAEVDSLMDKLNDAEKNRVKERAAQRKANIVIKERTEANPNMSKEDIRKIGQQALSRYRTELGSVARRDRNMLITDREWEAIQKGAISESKLSRILNNTDPDNLRQRAMPKERNTLSDVKVARIKALSSTYTLAQIAEMMNISPSTVSKYLKGVK